jgi:hypothetical protein
VKSHDVHAQFVAHAQTRRPVSARPQGRSAHSWPSKAQGWLLLMPWHSGGGIGPVGKPHIAPPTELPPVGASPPRPPVGVCPPVSVLPPTAAPPPTAVSPPTAVPPPLARAPPVWTAPVEVSPASSCVPPSADPPVPASLESSASSRLLRPPHAMATQRPPATANARDCELRARIRRWTTVWQCRDARPSIKKKCEFRLTDLETHVALGRETVANGHGRLPSAAQRRVCNSDTFRKRSDG